MKLAKTLAALPSIAPLIQDGNRKTSRIFPGGLFASIETTNTFLHGWWGLRLQDCRADQAADSAESGIEHQVARQGE